MDLLMARGTGAGKRLDADKSKTHCRINTSTHQPHMAVRS